MSASSVYTQVHELLTEHLDERVSYYTRERLTLLVTGILGAKSASPARVAQALHTLGLSRATPESIERQIRRTENDVHLCAATCVHPLAKAHLALGHPAHLLLILDPSLQEDRTVMVAVNVWYRGRSLPLCWSVWPANTPLQGERFWPRVQALLEEVAALLPRGVPVTLLADRAFGSPAFTDLVVAQGWHFVVRVQDQTRVRDAWRGERQVRSLVSRPTDRAKLRGEAFKKGGWRSVSVVVVWRRGQKGPLCVVSDRPPDWALAALYRRRFSIEPTFRDYKSYGWQWEQGQVRDLAHWERLLCGMALATWVALMVGTQVAAEYLAQPATGGRRTRPWVGKFSLFALGLQRLQEWFAGQGEPLSLGELSDWEAPNWQIQITNHHRWAFIFRMEPVR